MSVYLVIFEWLWWAVEAMIGRHGNKQEPFHLHHMMAATTFNDLLSYECDL